MYLHVRDGRTATLDEGIYFYNAVAHELAPVLSRTPLDTSAFLSDNGVVARQAAFALYLIADVGALTPKYGSASVRLATLEAGAITMVLRAEAARCGVGLCQIGEFDDRDLVTRLSLDQTRPVVAALLGGPLATPDDGYEEGEL